MSRKHLKHKNAHGDYDAAVAKAAAVVTHVQSLSQEVGSGDEGLGLFGFDLSSAETDFLVAGRGAGEEESKPIQTSPPIFFVSYDIFLSIMEAAKPVFSVCTHDGGCAY